ncbi:MAG TPA: hypothetical protein VFA67_07835 [Candidatus Sulfotelmatobacter sp.]|nr:hypothetical protein [Candidatus Sulfotelmatobacter sp.]
MKTQAWGWLAGAVLAAGLNASYHDGGLQWAHRAVEQVRHNSSAVMALATGRADQFLAEANLLAPRREAPSCPLTAALAEARTVVAPHEFELQRIQIMSAREQAQLARLEANRARIEARVARIHIPAAAFNPVVVQSPRICPRVRVNAPRIPAMKLPVMPVVHLTSEGGSV